MIKFLNKIINKLFKLKKLYKQQNELKFLNKDLVGRVGYAPTTPAMSMQYSTIELTAPYMWDYYGNILNIRH